MVVLRLNARPTSTVRSLFFRVPRATGIECRTGVIPRLPRFGQIGNGPLGHIGRRKPWSRLACRHGIAGLHHGRRRRRLHEGRLRSGRLSILIFPATACQKRNTNSQHQVMNHPAPPDSHHVLAHPLARETACCHQFMTTAASVKHCQGECRDNSVRNRT
jgi:hypothetical protein